MTALSVLCYVWIIMIIMGKDCNRLNAFKVHLNNRCSVGIVGVDLVSLGCLVGK